MMSTRGLALVLLCGPLLLGCTSSPEREPAAESEPPVVQLGAPGEDNRTLSPEELESTQAPAHTEADVEFVQAMIPHHQQALEMTAMVDRRSADPRLPLLAERLEVSQLDEIAQMEDWLTQRGEEAGDHGHHHGGPGDLMPGMLTRAELARLERARGEAFDQLFLVSMIRHHQGAVVMVDDLLTGGEGGQEPQVFQIAQHIDSDQRVEIARMERMLATR